MARTFPLVIPVHADRLAELRLIADRRGGGTTAGDVALGAVLGWLAGAGSRELVEAYDERIRRVREHADAEARDLEARRGLPVG